MADQLTGVLHEIAAADTNVAKPRRSSYFSPLRTIYGVGKDVPVEPANVIAALHVPVVDPNDPGAAVLATTSGTAPAQLDQALHLAMGGARQGERARLHGAAGLLRERIPETNDRRGNGCPEAAHRPGVGDARRLAAEVVRRTMCPP